MSTINAQDFGLSETASAAENTLALNSAANALREEVEIIFADNRFTPEIFRIPPGEYNIAEKSPTSKVGIDLSMIRGNGRVIMDCRGAVLITDATLTGKTVLDLIGSRWFSGYLPAIHTQNDGLQAPLTGIQFGRFGENESCDEHHFTDIQVRGFFSRTGVHNLHSETCVFINPNVFNWFDAADAYAWIQDGWAHWLPHSDADTSTMLQDSGHSFLMNTFIGGAFRAAGTIGVAMHLGRTRQHVFKNSYFVSFGLTTVEVAREADSLRFEDSHFESIINHCVRFTKIGSETTCVVNGLSFHEINANASDSIFGIGDDLTSVEINDIDCSVGNFNKRLTQGFFETPEKVRIGGGRVYLPSLDYWKEISSFQGDLITPKSFDIYGQRNFKNVPTMDDQPMLDMKYEVDQKVVVADDTAVMITPPAGIDVALVTVTTAHWGTASAMYWMYFSRNSSRILAKAGNYSVRNRVALTGRTGRDSRTTLGVHENKIFLENRMGGPREYHLVIKCMNL